MIGHASARANAQACGTSGSALRANEPAPAKPAIPGELVRVANLERWIACDNEGDLHVAYVHVKGHRVEQADFGLLELEASRVEGCTFAGCDFERALFTDVAFANCDFSTCQLADIVLSDTMGELRGCTMGLYQAAGIARRLGVVIAD